jgi:hypothetical protein
MVRLRLLMPVLFLLPRPVLLPLPLPVRDVERS